MDAVLLAVVSAGLFGAMTIALRFALRRCGDADAGTLTTILVALAVAAPFAVPGVDELGGAWPFLLAGALGPGLSQLLFTFAVRDAGSSRASVVVGTAPLFAVLIALVFLDEPLQAELLAGALSIVVGGALLAAERGRPGHVRTIGLMFAMGSSLVFAVRDNFVRWLSGETEVDAGLAAATTLAAGAACVAAYVVVAGRPVPVRALRAFAPAGICFGLSYVCLFEAYYRGRVSVVSPLVATESLWGVALSAFLLRSSERVGLRLLAGAGLVVSGGILIGVFR